MKIAHDASSDSPCVMQHPQAAYVIIFAREITNCKQYAVCLIVASVFLFFYFGQGTYYLFSECRDN